MIGSIFKLRLINKDNPIFQNSVIKIMNLKTQNILVYFRSKSLDLLKSSMKVILIVLGLILLLISLVYLLIYGIIGCALIAIGSYILIRFSSRGRRYFIFIKRKFPNLFSIYERYRIRALKRRRRQASRKVTRKVVQS